MTELDTLRAWEFDLNPARNHTKEFQGTILHGQAGVHAVCLELARRGWIPTLTLGNMPHVDVLATRLHNYTTTVPIQVKTIKSSNRGAGWPIKRKNVLPGIRYVLVEMPDNGSSPTFYVMTRRDIKRHLNRPAVKFTLVKLSRSDGQMFRGRWNRLMSQ